MEIIDISISTEYIKLDQLLKFANVAQSGGMAKEMIADGIVSVNDEECTMRGKKIRSGDSILVDFEDGAVLIKVK